ncbi:MAG: hypothetical protein M3O64_01790 [Chloroflexota bacterium]|nr:hypothetical protein [Chloroflexota bacterium]
MRRIAIIFSTVLVSLAISAQVAFADTCANFSRAAPTPTGPGPIIKGNWAWLPSVEPGAPDAWGFAPPGSAISIFAGLPGANGNYTNGATSSLLGMSANCPPGANANRQTTQGIQSFCQ